MDVNTEMLLNLSDNEIDRLVIMERAAEIMDMKDKEVDDGDESAADCSD